MGNDEKIRVIPHRGMKQIGGVCTEIATDEARVFFDLGAPVEGEGEQKQLEIEGLTNGKANTDAVFLTHYHGDHVGEIPNLLDGIPIYMHKKAKKILQLQQEHKVRVGEVVWAKDAEELTPDVPILIKDLKITPLASDHSAVDSLMYLVEGYDKRILITGDYRLHGFHAEELKETFGSLGPIDLMVTEGTNINRSSPNYHDEQWVEEEFARVFAKYKYVFLLTSSTNIDRIAAFSRRVPTGKHALADKYQTDVMRVADEGREEKYKSFKIWPYKASKRELYEIRGFGMIIRTSSFFLPIVKEYFEKYPEKTCLIYSMWGGYIEKYSNIKELLGYCENIEKIHVSGHITKEDFVFALDTIAPKSLIIHHVSDNSSKKDLVIPSNTKLEELQDGEELWL